MICKRNFIIKLKAYSVLLACLSLTFMALVLTVVSCSGGRSVPGRHLTEKLDWLQINAQSDRSYILEISANEGISTKVFSYDGKSNVKITIKGIGSNRAILLSPAGSGGPMLVVRSGVTLVLDRITLYGHSNNNASLIYVDDGGSLVMNNRSAITGNIVSSNNGGGVFVNAGGNFTMNGGSISGNTAGYGGGVCVEGGIFTMSGGSISNNTARSNGGGVSIRPNSAFTMSGGTMNGNSADFGGGIHLNGGTFSKTGGVITGYGSDSSNGNVARENGGHAVFAYISEGDNRLKETTSESDDNLFFDGTTAQVQFNGSWEYTVSFNANGGSGTVPAVQGQIGSSIILPGGSGFSRYGFTFGGWNTNANGTGINYNVDSSFTPTTGITLYAKWDLVLIPLTVNIWNDGRITSGASGSAVWYSFNVTSGTRYYVWWNDSYQGNSTKTLDVVVSASYSNGATIFTNVDSGWSSPSSFTANTNGTVRIRVTPDSSGRTGTFAVAYNTSNTRPR